MDCGLLKMVCQSSRRIVWTDFSRRGRTYRHICFLNYMQELTCLKKAIIIALYPEKEEIHEICQYSGPKKQDQ